MPVHVVAISGSLRKKSSNTAVLRAAMQLASSNLAISLIEYLPLLPPFNPDMEQAEPLVVQDFKKFLKNADAFIIASPEYAHGVSGVLKNALDWVVGSGEMVGKPVALINAAPRARHALDSLSEILTVMGAQLVPEASLTIPFASNRIDIEEILITPAYAGVISQALDALQRYMQGEEKGLF